MRFNVTLPTSGLTPSAEPWQYQAYHANSRLDHASARALGMSGAQDAMSRYLGTRGFRQFSRGPSIALDGLIPSRDSLQKVMARRRSSRAFGGKISLAELGTVLEQALGCTAVLADEQTGLSHALRAWPSAGGLYPIDVYVAAARVEGLDEGVYHYNPIRQAIELVPTMAAGRFIERAFFDQAITRDAAAALVFVANFERTTAKYGERGYRLVLLDAGHAGQNVLLVAEQLCLSASAIGGFCDDAISADLRLDGIDEAPVHAVILGRPA